MFKPSPLLTPLLVTSKKPFIHRDLSWIQFNERVLAEAEDVSNPLLERVKFLSISASNLDEFFMIRMAGLNRTLSYYLRKKKQSQAIRLSRVNQQIHENAARFVTEQEKVLRALCTGLQKLKVQIVEDLEVASEEVLAIAQEVFELKILPELSAPEAFTFNQLHLLENLQTAVVFPESGVWFRIPKKIRGSFVSGSYVFFTDQLLKRFIASAFSLLGSPVLLRLTRDADMSMDLEEEDPESIPEVVRTGLIKREKGRPVRVQVLSGISSDQGAKILNVFRLQPMQVFTYAKTFFLNSLWSSTQVFSQEVPVRKELFYPEFISRVPEAFVLDGFLEALKKRDFILHHPYDSFDAFVHWVKLACDDPNTIQIDQTVYRMDALSPVLDHLKKAALTKKVRVVIELRARFDELNNLTLADELRKAGIEVHFGFGKLKLHAKVTLVTRVENGVKQLFTHLSSGNYNSVTARHYTDLAILTANEAIGKDAQYFFDAVCAQKMPDAFKVLVSAPTQLHKKLRNLIDKEIEAAKKGQDARIFVKVNALVDPVIIEKLYTASRSGVQIDLIVRGACSLIPGIKGLSENIHVSSIVDRFLEHSRIYYFESSGAMYISSADWMPRNFFSRLELAFPVLDQRIFSFIKDTMIPAYLADYEKGRILNAEGCWTRYTGKGRLRAQFFFEELAHSKYKDTVLYEKTNSD